MVSQLLELGVRPAVFEIGTMEGKELEAEDISTNNSIQNARLKLLLGLGLLSVRGDRLVPTVKGREVLELPALLFISKAPRWIEVSFARAESAIYSRRPADCFRICAVDILETYLKVLIREGGVPTQTPVAEGEGARSRPVEKMTLGQLGQEFFRVMSSKRGVRKQDLKQARSVLDACVGIRNQYFHANAVQSEKVAEGHGLEDAFSFLQLTRVFVNVVASRFGSGG